MQFDQRNPDEWIDRYLLLLCIAKNNPTFSSIGVEMNGSDCIKFYRLEKIAKYLRLDFDRTKTASSIYKKLEENGYITIVTTQDHEKCIKLTKKGEEKCEDLIKKTI